MVTRLFLCMLLLASANWTSAETQARSFDLNGVTELVFDGDITVKFTQADNAQAMVTLVKGDWDDVEIKQTKALFKVSGKTGFWNFWGSANAELEIKISVPQLSRLEMVGEVDFHGKSLNVGNLEIEMVGASYAGFSDSLNADNLDLDITGASKFEAHSLNAEAAKIELTGASNVVVSGSGSIAKLALELTGASNFEAASLVGQSVIAEATGASNIELEVSEQLKASLSGASNLRYGGSPKLNVNTSGASNVKAY
ncbi:GIN domain-containing protein [Gilvimarinus sp. DA14]|uniref:GIN domain-containing protein n=1 Tax=Gilvimarinus sp. DA14 TaxID=2956798 RepID=UPI0020B6BC2F|nr:DUF2807 domain-containing protein [Gilvimarinus sp. DA14]UTF58980.1 DUF2807 domain-containing protein [Gilvimarinus sp. DA14]